MAITINKKLGPYEYALFSECDITEDEHGNVVSRTPKEGATLFNLHPLNGFDKLEIDSELERIGNDKLKMSAKGARKAIAAGLRGWRNMRDQGGNDVPYSEDAVDRLTHFQLGELAWEIIGNANMPEEERKN